MSITPTSCPGGRPSPRWWSSAPDADGHIDLADLAAQLDRYASRPLRIGSFSAASNVTGILSDTDAIAALLHAHGALSLWDYAAAGPYVPIRVRESAPGAGDHKDAIFLSPHKFIGGPQTPGVLVVRRDLVRNRVPTVPGGGTVAFVDPIGHQYLDDPVAREEGGTPAIVESIRAGLVFALKQAVGTEVIQASEERLWKRALRRWSANPQHRGPRQPRRPPAADRLAAHPPRRPVPASQLRGRAAQRPVRDPGPRRLLLRRPYGHRLLAIGAARSHAFRDEIGHGCEGIKPGWTRINFNYFISGTVAGYLIDAVDLIATDGHRLLTDYRFDPHTGLWRHRNGPPQPPLRLRDLRYTADGTLRSPALRTQAGEESLGGYLRQARGLLAARPEQIDDGPTGLPGDFEALRWFPIPPVCLTRTGPLSDGVP